MNVLLVDDDPEFREFASFALEEAGIAHESVAHAEAALDALRGAPEGRFDIVLLDVEMPGASGWELLADLREAGREIPVIFVTGRSSVEERVRGLRMGADDYLCKPVEFDELIARLEAVLRRRSALEPRVFGDLRVDPARRRVERAGKPVELSPKEYDLLLALVEAGGEPVSRESLLRDVWDIDFDPETNLVTVHVGRLRRKLDRLGRPCIETVRGTGYRLVAHPPVSADG